MDDDLEAAYKRHDAGLLEGKETPDCAHQYLAQLSDAPPSQSYFLAPE
jgi:hypothetical protein